jgi:hypothetical protein
VADDVDGRPGDPVEGWTARPTGLTRRTASAPDADHRPRLVGFGLHRAVRFDGVDDRLDLGLDDLTARTLPPLAVAVVLATDDDAGHLLGTGASVAGALRTFGTGLVVDRGRALAKAVADGEGVLVEGATVTGGAPHVVYAELLADGVELAVDGAGRRVAGAPVAHPFSRATLGAADGNAAGAAVEPLAADVADVRVWGGPLDTCDRALLYEDTLRTYGAPSPAGPNLAR